METKALKKVIFGIVVIFLGGFVSIAVQKYLELNLWAVGFLFFSLALWGVGVILKNVELVIELVPERRYKLLHYSNDYATMEYRDEYGIKTVRSFENVKFCNGIQVIYNPTVGKIYTACKKKGGDKIILRERED